MVVVVVVVVVGAAALAVRDSGGGGVGGVGVMFVVCERLGVVLLGAGFARASPCCKKASLAKSGCALSAFRAQ